MATPFMIGQAEIDNLRRAQALAKLKPIPLDIVREQGFTPDEFRPKLTLKDREEKLRLSQRAIPESEHVTLPFGYRCSISYEDQPPGICIHVSLSSPIAGRTPIPAAMEMVLEALSVPHDAAIEYWLEEFDPGHHALNVVALIGPKIEGHA